jgi:hypothetical protein
LKVGEGPIGDIEETILAPPCASADAAHAPLSARWTEPDQPRAIHREVDAGDRGSVLARQEADGACNFFWAYHPEPRLTPTPTRERKMLPVTDHGILPTKRPGRL